MSKRLTGSSLYTLRISLCLASIGRATSVDGSLPFGLRSAPKIFKALADLLNWILLDHCQVCILHYSLVLSWHGKRSAQSKSFNPSMSILQDVAKVVPSGKTFIHRSSDLLHLPAATSPRAVLRLNHKFLSDIAWWCCFLPHCKGTSMIPLPSTAPHASGSWGCGVF